MFLEQQISILEWFLNDHVTGVIMLKIQLCITEIYYIVKYIQIENSYLKLWLFLFLLYFFLNNSIPSEHKKLIS